MIFNEGLTYLVMKQRRHTLQICLEMHEDDGFWVWRVKEAILVLSLSRIWSLSLQGFILWLSLKMMRKICIYSAQVKLCRFGRNRKTVGIFAVLATVQQLNIRALRNMTKRHQNLSYNISLERYGCLISIRFYRMTFKCLQKKLWSIE